MSKSERPRIPNHELALLENSMALVLDAIHHLQRASMTTTNPETLTHMLGISRALSKLKELLVNWKMLRVDDSDPTVNMPATLTKTDAIAELNGSLALLEQAFQEISALKTKLEAQNTLEEK